MSDASTDEQVADLLAEWEERLLDGLPATPEELCRDRPVLIPLLRQAIARLGRADALFQDGPTVDIAAARVSKGDGNIPGSAIPAAPAADSQRRLALERTTDSTSGSMSLVVRLKARESEAWDRFARIYGPSVYGWARAAGLQDDDAADVGQEVFKAVAVHVDEFRHDRPGDTLRGWIWTITRNKIREHFRRRSRSPESKFGDEGLADVAFVPEQPPDVDVESAGLAQRALDLIRTDFEPKTWQAFWRTAVEGQRPIDVAREVGISVAAVYMGRSRVLARLRQELGEFLC